MDAHCHTTLVTDMRLKACAGVREYAESGFTGFRSVQGISLLQW